jgi:ribonuclease HI
MNSTTPHLLLSSRIENVPLGGRWQFLLRSKDGGLRFEASDTEPDIPSERLDLLTVVRALESLDQPSRVTIVECSDYIWKGVRFGLPEWRATEWRWEFFGQMVPVKNADLWQRLDRVLEFHDVECRRRRFDQPPRQAEGICGPHWQSKRNGGLSKKLSNWLKYAVKLARRNVCELALRWKAFIA